MAAGKIVNKIKQRALWYFYELYWLALLIKRVRRQDFPAPAVSGTKFSIGITTFKERYRLFFKKLLKKMTYLFPDSEIIIAVNGNYDPEKQAPYLDKIKKYCRRFPNVKTVTYLEPQGLSKLWNQIIINSGSDKIFIFNDDIKVSPFFRKDLMESGITGEKVATIKNSWSYFLISKEIIATIGWFDERLLEISGEDDDYLARLALKGISAPGFKIDSIQNYSHKLKINSFGKDMTGSQPYSDYNSEFLQKKWHKRGTPLDGYVLSRGKYWKLKEGMETPDFYGHKDLK